MFRISRITVVGIAVLLVALVASPRAWARQGPAQRPAQLSRVDLVASLSWKQTAATAGADRVWTGPGFSLGVNGNVSEHVAIATGVEKFAHGGGVVLGGLQFSTSFYYGSGRDPVPGRFFAKALVGVTGAGSLQTRGAGQIDVGADILLSRTKPVGLRWEVGYDVIPGDPIHHAYGRVAVGLVFGPRI